MPLSDGLDTRPCKILDPRLADLNPICYMIHWAHACLPGIRPTIGSSAFAQHIDHDSCDIRSNRPHLALPMTTRAVARPSLIRHAELLQSSAILACQRVKWWVIADDRASRKLSFAVHFVVIYRNNTARVRPSVRRRYQCVKF